MDWKTKRVETEARNEDLMGKAEFSDNSDAKCLEQQNGNEETRIEVETEPDAPERVDDKKEFQVTYQCLPDTDEYGVGLNVGAERMEDGQVLLVVESFRRLSGKDIGPAEANSDASVTPIVERKSEAVEVNETNCLEAETLLHGNPQVAALVRQLATTNKLLQEQLLASRLKQEEQSIQLDQLHALYARTQAEGLPLFSLSKSIRPFSRKSGSTIDGVEKSTPNKIQTELIEAVNAGYTRLRQEFQLQHMIDKRELEGKYAKKAQELEEATTKKVFLNMK
ncbi:hypothetical protein PInf_007107 [Phytophthora infestans]|nr:hypothetical protein PInf_007107 [Phytophthora infestans]